jgi:uncharacterized protein (DUF934 family)
MPHRYSNRTSSTPVLVLLECRLAYTRAQTLLATRWLQNDALLNRWLSPSNHYTVSSQAVAIAIDFDDDRDVLQDAFSKIHFVCFLYPLILFVET